MHTTNTKRKINASAQKLKGKAQQALGEYQMATGQNVKGGISKAKGVLNEKVADAKLSFEQNKNKAVNKAEDDHADDVLI